MENTGTNVSSDICALSLLLSDGRIMANYRKKRKGDKKGLHGRVPEANYISAIYCEM